MKREDLKDYFELLNSFQLGRITAVDFESQYLSLFKGDNRQFPQDVFIILNQLFSDVDMFVFDPEIREPGNLDRDQLFKCSQEAYDKLRNLM